GDQQEKIEEIEKRVEELNESMATKLKPVLSDAQDRDLKRWQGEQSSFFPGRQGSKPPMGRQGRSAFLFVDSETGKQELFDFVTFTERSAGYKVHFHKDHPLNGMTTINLIFEYNDRFVLAEPLAYEVYRRAGNSAELSDFVRLS